MTKSNEPENKVAYYLNIISAGVLFFYEVLVGYMLYEELNVAGFRATDLSLILIGLFVLPFIVILLGNVLGGSRLINLRAGNLQVEIERLEQKVEKKAKELVEQLEGKLSTAEQTLYPLVGGRNAFSEKRLEQNSLIIGSKDFAANIVVAELVAQYLELNGIKCERRIPNGGTVTNYAALSNGWIDLFVDYTGTGCMLFNIDFHEKTEDEILTTLNILSQERYGFEWLEPFGTKTNYCLVMKQSFADENHIESISDINNYGLGRLRFCANYEFMNRLDGFPGLKETYKLRFLSEKIVSYADRYNYIDNDEADISVGHTTDPSLRALNLKELVDDKQFFPDYLETPLVRSEALYMIGGLRDLLNGIKELRLKDDDITTLIHDYNTNVDSLSNSVRKMIQDKKEKMPQG